MKAFLTTCLLFSAGICALMVGAPVSAQHSDATQSDASHQSASSSAEATNAEHEGQQIARPLTKAEHKARAAERTIQWRDWVGVKISEGADINAIAQATGASEIRTIGSLTQWFGLRYASIDAAKEQTDVLPAREDVLWAEQQRELNRSKRTNDTYFDYQWHLKNTGTNMGINGIAGNDANVEPAWLLGYTGSGVDLAIVDDGVQYSHPDLTDRYSSTHSVDLVDNDADPAPESGDDHGTACAGLAVATANNNVGVAGSGYGARMTGIRLLGTGQDDMREASAFGQAIAEMEIYSNSWGPSDTAGEFEDIGTMAKAAVQAGVTTGRSGRGAIYTIAAGNGLQFDNDANQDGYAAMPETIAIAAIDENGMQAPFSEHGANILIAGPTGDGNVMTTDRTGTDGYNDGTVFSANNDYTNDFDGTSASTPVVSGIIALMLEANPQLTWRDVQHVLARTARSTPQMNADAEWQTNGAGLRVNQKWGFGMVDAEAAVLRARGWTSPGQRQTYTTPTNNTPIVLPDDNMTPQVSTVNVSGANSLYLEHVVVEMELDHTFWGDLFIELESPDGTVSRLNLNGTVSNPANNQTDWRFMSVHFWGEQSAGTWTLRASDRWNGDTGRIVNWKLITWGTDAEPGSWGAQAAPVISNGPNGIVRIGERVNLQGQYFGGATVEVGGVAQTLIDVSPTLLTFDMAAGTPLGTQNIVVTTPEGTDSRQVEVSLAPFIGNLSPNPVTLGRSLTITGTNFNNSPTVTIGGVTQTITNSTATTLELTVDTSTPTGSQMIVVSDSNGQDSDTLTVQPPLTINSITPSTVAAGSTLTITGENLAGAGVVIGGISQSVQSATYNQILVTVDMITPNGAQTVQVNGPAGSDTGTVTVTGGSSGGANAPSIQMIDGVNVSTATPTLAAGTTVTITGARIFTPTVDIGGVSQTVTPVLPTEIRITISVSTPNGSQILTLTTSNGSDTAMVTITGGAGGGGGGTTTPAKKSSGGGGCALNAQGGDFAWLLLMLLPLAGLAAWRREDA